MKLSWSRIPNRERKKKNFSQLVKTRKKHQYFLHKVRGSLQTARQSDLFSISSLWVVIVICFPAKVAVANCLHYVKWMVILIALITVFLIENSSQS